MNKERVQVVINDIRRIPTIGKGPIRNPISITREQFNLLKLLGYKVEEVVKNVVLEKIEIPEEEIKEEEVEETAEEIVGETAEEEIKEEEVEETPEEIVELDIDKMTKKELKAELDAREIKYSYNATVEQLRELLTENL